MERKEFLKRSMQVGCGCTAFAFFGQTLLASDEATEKKDEASDRRAEFVHDWVDSLLTNMDGRVDKQAAIDLMIANGRACAGRTAGPLIEAHKGNLEGFLAEMAKHFPEDGVKHDGNRVTLAWNRCLCPVVSGKSETLPGVYCHCSEGWMRQVFETIVGHGVKVDIVKAIKRGDKTCEFVIHV